MNYATRICATYILLVAQYNEVSDDTTRRGSAQFDPDQSSTTVVPSVAAVGRPLAYHPPTFANRANYGSLHQND